MDLFLLPWLMLLIITGLFVTAAKYELVRVIIDYMDFIYSNLPDMDYYNPNLNCLFNSSLSIQLLN